MVAWKALYRQFSRLTKVLEHKQIRRYDKRPDVLREKNLAASDGELNMFPRSCACSSSSLPGTPGGEAYPANNVLSWALSFEKLLEDPSGVNYFTAFLKSEVSEENILFWQACEEFKKIPDTSLEQLRATSRSIYETYLRESAPHSINIDDTAKKEEKDLEEPTPDMFNKAQAQIFKLMKMDSYRRFVRSPLYQSCTFASVEGKCLPQVSTEPLRTVSWEDVSARSSDLCDKKSKKSESSALFSASNSDKRRQKRGSWGDASLSRPAREDNKALKSSSNVELDSLYRLAEMPPNLKNSQSGPRSMEQSGVSGMEGGYCCVYLPDGSASLAPTPSGLPIRDMLAGLCEKRGISLKDVIIYLQGKDKPLSLDQDCSVLRDQQVLLELRVMFILENALTGKTGGIMVKSSKTLQEALSMLLNKHCLKPQDVQVTIVGSDEAVAMNTTVFRLANKTLRLDKARAGREQSNNLRGAGAATQAGSGAPESRLSLQIDKVKTSPPKPSKNPDMDGLLDMLSRAQCCRVEDQRGLLTKEQLEVPLFLQLPQSSEESSTATTTTTTTTIISSVNPDEDTDGAPAEAEQQNLRETSV
ncbi:regulator of G-protein signaling 14-like isoform X3 [Stigmatopora nigra]